MHINIYIIFDVLYLNAKIDVLQRRDVQCL